MANTIKVVTGLTPQQQRVADLSNYLVSLGLLDNGSNAAAPLSQMDYAPDLTPPVRLFFRTTATQAQKDQVNGIVNGWDFRPRVARQVNDIRNDLNALTATQKTNIRNDLFTGNPSKAQQDTGPGQDALLVLWTLQQVAGLSTADKVIVAVSAAALYCRDNPGYLVNPTFDPTINVAGDQPLP